MTSAAITMTTPEAASPVQMYRATYSPDDNKLRLYAVSRLDPETYKKVHDAGFRWAPKQALFVAPAWTPGREDVLLSLAGEIEDEDSTLAERQEARAERFTGYSGNRLQWLYAIDVLIETQGEVCLLPLPGDAAERLFPSVRFRVRERSRHKSALVMQKYSRQQAREAEQKARAYQALVAQAEIELAFHSPETVGSWHARWSDRVAEHDLETLFWQWGERFPSLAGMERWQWQDMPFWQVIAEASLAAREAGHAVREMERWMVPNKLREAA